jgi:uroporphyrinogen-III decarboxylase
VSAPLTPDEREDFRQRLARRLPAVQARTADVFAFKETDDPPVVVNSAFYWVFGLDTTDFPEAYFTDPAVMTAFQERLFYDQIRDLEDDWIPYLMPWFGTVVTASAFGCRVEFPPRQDPAVDPRHYPVATPEDVRRLEQPDPEKDGLMPEVLRFLRYMKANSFLPVGYTDFQGPLTTANQLMGYDKLIYLMNDYPSAMHELMEKVTTALIQWVKLQKLVVGEADNEVIGDQQVYLGRNCGVWFSDDDCVLMSPSSYREFVVPYNSRILRAFNGGVVHYCGNATHQADNFLATDGLLGINTYALYNLKALHELKRRIEGRLVLLACDFTAVDFEAYYRDLLPGLSRRGLILNAQYAPAVGLLPGGKYDAVQRDPVPGRRAVLASIRRQLAGLMPAREGNAA